MTDIRISQAEADALMALEKRRIDDNVWNYPRSRGCVTIPLVSVDGREAFLLDLRRSRIDLAKGTYQNRGRQVVILARLDFGSAPHRNPDGKEVGSPHLHIYREGYDDKWAFPVPADKFSNLADPWQMLTDFMGFCNIIQPPLIERGVFK